MDTLSKQHVHCMDQRIQLDEETHSYTIDHDKEYISVTRWIHTHFKGFDADAVIDKMMIGRNWTTSKYFGQTREHIKLGWDRNRDDAANAGNKLHYDIECYYNGKTVNNTSSEYKQFILFVKNNQLKPYRTEWTVFDPEIKLAGTIDMTYILPNGHLMIYDWKRTKHLASLIHPTFCSDCAITECIQHLPNTKYTHYALQLNIYKAILERNYNVVVEKLCLVCFHPDQYTYEVIEVADLKEEIDRLFEERKQSIVV
uniref:PD-(D/E)XK endonuclease-like domain-containing protein n=1 Tax=viral metagenome TaxID=1070528 RepID=A0A6C0JXC4_9ZZZZ